MAKRSLEIFAKVCVGMIKSESSHSKMYEPICNPVWTQPKFDFVDGAIARTRPVKKNQN